MGIFPLVRILKTKEERGKIWTLSTIQIGYGAVFGALALVLRLLGLGIPIGPMMTIDPWSALAMTGPAFAGPIGAIIVAVGAYIGSSVLIVQIYIPNAIVYGIIYKYFRHPWYYVVNTVAMIPLEIAWPVYWFSYIYGFAPPLAAVYILGVAWVGDWIIGIVLLEALRRSSGRIRALVG